MKSPSSGATYFVLVLCGSILVCGTCLAQQTTLNYQTNNPDRNQAFANPERGWYEHEQSRTDESPDYVALTTATPETFRRNNITLILRLFYLDGFRSGDISSDYLRKMQADFDVIRESGLKAIVRFAYTLTDDQDATKERIFKHLDQLREVIARNADVIAVFQAGFIGRYGEWDASSNFSVKRTNDEGNDWYDASGHYADRREVLDKIIETFPDDRFTQVRTPNYKRQLFKPATGELRAVNAADFQTTPVASFARAGHFNDCFLASDTDAGTYLAAIPDTNPETNSEYNYLKEETKYLPMGGETCAQNPPPGKAATSTRRSDCRSAKNELDDLHWSFLNKDHSLVVLNSWAEDCKAEIARRLGYRFVLSNGTYDNAVAVPASFDFSFGVANAGYSAPFNRRAVELVFRKSDGTEVRKQLPGVDPRRWFKAADLPASANGINGIRGTLSVADVKSGSYELLLNLPDPRPSLRRRPAYSIRLANADLWEEGTGYNKLNHRVTITNTTGGAAGGDGHIMVSSVMGSDSDRVAYMAPKSISFLPGFDSNGQGVTATIKRP